MPVDPQVAAIVAELERLAERLIAKITFDVVANLVEATPVDTGWARANWIPGIGGDPDDASDDPTGEVGRANAARERGLALVANYRLEKGAVHVLNNVPYILALNDGRSAQAPRNFVQQAVAKATSPRALSGL